MGRKTVALLMVVLLSFPFAAVHGQIRYRVNIVHGVTSKLVGEPSNQTQKKRTALEGIVRLIFGRIPLAIACTFVAGFG